MRKKSIVLGTLLAATAPGCAWASADSGVYVGVHSGWQSSSDHFHGYWKVSPPIDWDLGTHSGTGAIAGVHAGFDRSIGKAFVGLEADFETTSAKVDYTMNGWNMVSQTRLQSSLRAKAGIKLGRVRIFGTGGLAVAGTDHSYRDTNPGGTEVYGHSRTMFGYAAGGGIDYRLSDRTTLNFEYRHANYGRMATEVNPAWQEVDMHRMYNNSVRVGISFRL